MLRGRCSCANSERPRRSVFASSSPSFPLTPLFPLHTRHSPVSPIIPVHTQKQGGGGTIFLLAVRSSSALSVSSAVSLVSPAFSCSPLATRLPAVASAEEGHSTPIPIVSAPLATPALRVVPAPTFTTTARTHVGAPTFLSRERTTARQQFPDPRAMLSSDCGLLTVDCEPLSPLTPIIPALTDHSPVSPIIPALTQNRGVGYLNGNVPKICRRADILECGGSPPPLEVTQCGKLNCLGETDGVSKAGASSRTAKQTQDEAPASTWGDGHPKLS